MVGDGSGHLCEVPWSVLIARLTHTGMIGCVISRRSTQHARLERRSARPGVRVGNEPRYSGSARKKLGSSSARELNESSLSLNLGLINLGLDSGSARARLEKARLRSPGPIRR